MFSISGKSLGASFECLDLKHREKEFRVTEGQNFTVHHLSVRRSQNDINLDSHYLLLLRLHA